MTLTDGYHYAIIDGNEVIIEKRKNLKHPYYRGFCVERYECLGKVPSYGELKGQSETAYTLATGLIARNEKIEQLKELLKECRSAYLNAEKNYGYDDSILEICSPMIDKIDEALR